MTFPQKQRETPKKTEIEPQRDKGGKKHNIATWNVRSKYEGKLNSTERNESYGYRYTRDKRNEMDRQRTFQKFK
jgi:hypothetical protein